MIMMTNRATQIVELFANLNVREAVQLQRHFNLTAEQILDMCERSVSGLRKVRDPSEVYARRLEDWELRQGEDHRTIKAIKVFRNLTGAMLRDSKDFIDGKVPIGDVWHFEPNLDELDELMRPHGFTINPKELPF